MIVKGYCCADCSHGFVCAFKDEMESYFDKLQKKINENNFNFVPSYETLPAPAFYSLRCTYFIHKHKGEIP